MEKEARILKIVLRVAGVIMLTALFAVILPTETMKAIHLWIGLGEMPEGPIVEYLARSLSLFYALHGALLLFIATDTKRYIKILKFYLFLSYGFALALFFIDLYAPMPMRWTLSEAPPYFVLITILLILVRRIERGITRPLSENATKNGNTAA